MWNKKVVINEEKLIQSKAVIGAIREVSMKADTSEIASVCLGNDTIREIAGYTDNFDENKYNPYVRDYLDKLIYDEHNKKVKEAKQTKDDARLQILSDEAMEKAGYTGSSQVNKYFKSFVDRTLINKEFNKLYKAENQNNREIIDAIYKRIYQMSSYSDKRPYGVVNEYAQNFVDNRIEEFEERGIHISKDSIEQYAI